eukprot:COSAG06_NODE_560_length_14294_cov_16.177739_2_plen_138_part_00
MPSTVDSVDDWGERWLIWLRTVSSCALSRVPCLLPCIQYPACKKTALTVHVRGGRCSCDNRTINKHKRTPFESRVAAGPPAGRSSAGRAQRPARPPPAARPRTPPDGSQRQRNIIIWPYRFIIWPLPAHHFFDSLMR